MGLLTAAFGVGPAHANYSLQNILSATIAIETPGVKTPSKFWHRDIETKMKAKKRDVKLSFPGMSVCPAQEVRQRGHE